MKKCDIGLFGLGVMGKSLAINLNNHKIKTSVYNIDKEVTQLVVEENEGIMGYENIEDFINSISNPRKVLLMVTAGEAVDSVIKSITPYLEEGDLIIDGGNSNYLDSERRELELKALNINFMSLGISGGEKGALTGPSLMPSGTKEAYESVQPLLDKISAQDIKGEPCARYMGTGSSGHFIKMIHNGIEYAEMQILSEIYGLLSKRYEVSNKEIYKTFEALNQGITKSYLLDLVLLVLKKKTNDDQEYLLNLINDVAYQKGTGAWTVEAGVRFHEYIPSIYEGVGVRYASEDKVLRSKISKKYTSQKNPLENINHETILSALLGSRLSIYAQGLSIIKKASEAYGWHINLSDVIHNWKEGCIIKSDLLNILEKATEQNHESILLNDDVVQLLNQHIENWRNFVSWTVSIGYPTSTINASLTYLDLLSQENLSTNIIQALRDAFGGHQVELIDKEGLFHFDWN